MISHEPKEMYRYFVSSDFRVLDKMVNRIDDKSICEVLIKVYNEILNQSNSHSASGVPGITNPAAAAVPTPASVDNENL